MRVIFNQFLEPLKVVWEAEFQQMLEDGLVNKDQIWIS